MLEPVADSSHMVFLQSGARGPRTVFRWAHASNPLVTDLPQARDSSGATFCRHARASKLYGLGRIKWTEGRAGMSRSERVVCGLSVSMFLRRAEGRGRRLPLRIEPANCRFLKIFRFVLEFWHFCFSSSGEHSCLQIFSRCYTPRAAFSSPCTPRVHPILPHLRRPERAVSRISSTTPMVLARCRVHRRAEWL